MASSVEFVALSVGTATTPRKLRADATRNLERVLAGARRATTEQSIDVGYHEIARLAGVGVGTVYRRFPDREQLLEAVLLDVLAEMRRHAAKALADPDPWAGFAKFFTEFAPPGRRAAPCSAQRHPARHRTDLHSWRSAS